MDALQAFIFGHYSMVLGFNEPFQGYLFQYKLYYTSRQKDEGKRQRKE
jgi:hypothetical protein